MKKFYLGWAVLLIFAATFATKAQQPDEPVADFTARLEAARVNFNAQPLKTDLASHNFSTLTATKKTSRQTAFKYERPAAKERTKRYFNRVAGPLALLGTAISSGIAQATDSPEEWEDNFKGYARRFGSSIARTAIRETIIYGLDETFKVDSSYYKKGKSEKFNKRLANALLTTVTARTPSGKRVVGFPRFIGTFAAGVISYETWYPDRFDYKDGLRSGAVALGVNAAFNLVREFILPSRK